jgi:hypothetical protein
MTVRLLALCLALLAVTIISSGGAEARYHRHPESAPSHRTMAWAGYDQTWATARGSKVAIKRLAAAEVFSPARTVRRVEAQSNLSSECRTAAALGGPCGCFASEQLFGHSVRDLWRADAWLRFPRTSPGPGTAAVWPGRHVALVEAVNGDGTVTVRDSWNAHHVVRTAGLVFVAPR